MSDIEDVPIREGGIRLGQLLKYVGVAESGADAAQLIAGGDVRVDGEVELRRGRQLEPGAVIEVAGPAGSTRYRVS